MLIVEDKFDFNHVEGGPVRLTGLSSRKSGAAGGVGEALFKFDARSIGCGHGRRRERDFDAMANRQGWDNEYESAQLVVSWAHRSRNRVVDQIDRRRRVCQCRVCQFNCSLITGGVKKVFTERCRSRCRCRCRCLVPLSMYTAQEHSQKSHGGFCPRCVSHRCFRC